MHPNSTSPWPCGNFTDKPPEPHGKGESRQPSPEGTREHPHQLAGLQHPPRSHRYVVTYVPAVGLTQRLTQLLSTDTNNKRAREFQMLGTGFRIAL